MMFFLVRREKEEHVTAKNSKQGKSSKIEHVFAQLRSFTISNALLASESLRCEHSKLTWQLFSVLSNAVLWCY